MITKFPAVFATALGIFVFTQGYAQSVYKMSDNSKVHISGTSTLSDWTVRSEELAGEMTFTPSGKKAKDNDFDGGAIQEAKAVLEVSTIKSEKGETMDNKIYSALKRDSYPRITFMLTAPVVIPKSTGKVSATGNVEIAGVTRPMTFELDVAYEANVFHVSGSRSLKLTEFDVEPPTSMFGQIVTGDEIAVALDLYFSPGNK